MHQELLVFEEQPFDFYCYYFPDAFFKILNHPSATCFTYNSTDHCVSELRAVDADENLHNSPPDYKFFLAFSNYPVPNEEIFKPGHYRHFSSKLMEALRTSTYPCTQGYNFARIAKIYFSHPS